MIIDSIILARKDSKGIPHKNTIDFCGKPLIEWTIIQLKKTMKTGEIWVSSDGSKILDIAKKHNVNLIERPSDLSKDNSSSEDAWMHALRIIKKKKKVEVILAPQVTSPLREPSDFSNAIKLFKSSKADSLLSVCEIEDFFFGTMSIINQFQPIMIIKKDR